jgi:hypothetical protein
MKIFFKIDVKNRKDLVETKEFTSPIYKLKRTENSPPYQNEIILNCTGTNDLTSDDRRDLYQIFYKIDTVETYSGITCILTNIIDDSTEITLLT